MFALSRAHSAGRYERHPRMAALDFELFSRAPLPLRGHKWLVMILAGHYERRLEAKGRGGGGGGSGEAAADNKLSSALHAQLCVLVNETLNATSAGCQTLTACAIARNQCQKRRPTRREH